MHGLKDKIAIVTGGSRGIGAAIVRRLSASGAKVVVNYRQDAGAANALVDEVTQRGGIAFPIQADIAEPLEIERLFSESLIRFGRLDILVNNAGLLDRRPLDQIDAEIIDRLFATNVRGLLLCCREAAKAFGAKGGRIINISSNITRMGIPNSVVYSATKGAVDLVTQALAAELGPRQILVNTVSPGFIETDMNANAPADLRRSVLQRTPLGRVGTVDEIANVVAFLASAESGWVTGERIGVCGGLRG